MTKCKKRFCGITVILMMLILSVTLIACGSGTDPDPDSCTHIFNDCELIIND